VRPGFDGISIAIPLGKLHYATVHMLMPFSTASRSDALSSSPAVAMPERSA